MLHLLYMLQMLNGFYLLSIKYFITYRQIVVRGLRHTEGRGSLNGIIGELIEVRLGKDDQCRFCAQ